MLFVFRRVFGSAGYSATRLFLLEETDLRCGVADLDRISSQFWYLFNDSSGLNEALLKSRADEFGVELKYALSCAFAKDIADSVRLEIAIEQLVAAIKAKNSYLF